NPNIVKAVLGLIEPDSAVARALCFSRSPIPFDRDAAGNARYHRHVGIYAYTTSMLEEYMRLEESPLEHAERLEQLRWLEHGYTIAAAIRQSSHAGIDTEDQYRSFVARHSARSPGN
ncbi:MAG: 3-deoxy-manno-octulosonate cytidylyltransferase, partial [Planctomycetota bacterium]